jgi:hypothetical protein
MQVKNIKISIIGTVKTKKKKKPASITEAELDHNIQYKKNKNYHTYNFNIIEYTDKSV